MTNIQIVEVNTNITLTVRQVAPDVPIAVLAEEHASVDLLELSGATSVIPLKEKLGAVTGGWVAGRTAVRSVFHGALTGVLYAGGITVLSILDGSPATLGTLLGFIVGGVALGGLGGWFAERRRLSRQGDAS